MLEFKTSLWSRSIVSRLLSRLVSRSISPKKERRFLKSNRMLMSGEYMENWSVHICTLYNNLPGCLLLYNLY
jgi:hypothetical protein